MGYLDYIRDVRMCVHAHLIIIHMTYSLTSSGTLLGVVF